MYGLRLADLKDGRKAVIIRTSDRMTFKQCRRKWGFSSHLKRNLAPNALAAPLWFGSAIHYALEDYHGYNHFGRPADAFKAYCLSTAQNWKRELPSDAKEHWEMGIAMMDYYVDKWLAAYPRQPDQTFWAPNPITGVMEPQVEVNFEIPLEVPEGTLIYEYMRACGADCVLFRGTLDRVAIDDWGQLWVVEYKTAKIFQTTHFPTDPQVTAYVWATQQIYDQPVVGVIYHQFLKKVPKAPPLLSSGRLSTAQNMVTSYPLYKEELERLYGEVKYAPSQNQARMNDFMKAENTDRDRYIIRERVFRNAAQCQAEHQKIIMELEDYLNPDLPLYPNPSRDCARMCSFVTPCVNMDDGSDWESLLDDMYSERDLDIDRMWRRRLPSPQELKMMADLKAVPDLHDIQIQSQESYQAAEIAAGEYPLAEWEQNKGDPFAGMDERGTFNMQQVE